MVFAIAATSDTIYLGGQFDYIGPVTGSFVALDPTTGSADPAFPEVEGEVLAAVPDNSGGWYIGGAFRMVGTTPRNGLAHIRADHSLDPAWAPGVAGSPIPGTVYALATNGTTVFVGGEFNTVAGQPRSGLAALDATTGALRSAWDPSPSYPGYSPWVKTLALVGNTLYVGGHFTGIGGQSRSLLAALDIGTGLATSWNPNVTAASTAALVNVLAVDGSRLYIGGGFDNIGGQPRANLGAVDLTTGAPTTWAPNPYGTVRALAISGSTIYVGGDFILINGQTGATLVALDKTTGAASTWNPNPHGTISSLWVQGARLYVGGPFDTMAGQPRRALAAFDLATGSLASWDANPSGFVNIVAGDGATIYAGGAFESVGGYNRKNLAALDATTGVATSWNPQVSDNETGYVRALAVNGGTVYVGGFFGSVNGQPRSALAALDAETAAVTPWNPAPIDLSYTIVYTLAISGTNVYVGGGFQTIGGQHRAGLAAIDINTGLATAWDPAPGASSGSFVSIDALALHGNTIYVGGRFAAIGGQPRTNLAALDTTTNSANATTWNPAPNSTVSALAATNTAIYAGGSFDNIGGQARSYLAALDPVKGAATSWNPQVSGPSDPLGGGPTVFALATSGDAVYAGGYFDTAGGASRPFFVGLDANTAMATSWNPAPTGNVEAIVVKDGMLYAGGSFARFDGQLQPYFASNAVATSTGGATDITLTSAVLHGFVVSKTAAATSISFQLTDKSGDYSHSQTIVATPGSISSTAPTPVQAAVSGLAPGSTYFYRVVAEGAGTVYGGERSFRTIVVPTALTGPASDITSTSAQLSGTVNAGVDSAGVHFALTTISGDYQHARSIAATPSTVSGISTSAVSGQVSGLLPTTTYYYRIEASNQAGTAVGAERSFTTGSSPIAPRIFISAIWR